MLDEKREVAAARAGARWRVGGGGVAEGGYESDARGVGEGVDEIGERAVAVLVGRAVAGAVGGEGALSGDIVEIRLDEHVAAGRGSGGVGEHGSGEPGVGHGMALDAGVGVVGSDGLCGNGAGEKKAGGEGRRLKEAKRNAARTIARRSAAGLPVRGLRRAGELKREMGLRRSRGAGAEVEGAESKRDAGNAGGFAPVRSRVRFERAEAVSGGFTGFAARAEARCFLGGDHCGLLLADAGVGVDPVRLPRLAAIGREGLLGADRVRGQVAISRSARGCYAPDRVRCRKSHRGLL